MRIAIAAASPPSAAPCRRVSRDRRHRQHPARRRRHVAHRLDELIEKDRTAGGHGRRTPRRPARRSASRRGMCAQISSAPNSGTTSAAAATPPSATNERHDDRQARRTDRDDRARHGGRRHVPGRRKRQRRIRPRRLERQRLRHLQAPRGPALGLVQVAVGVRPAGDEAPPPDARRRRPAASSSATPTRLIAAARRTSTCSARTPSRQPIFLPCARDRGSNRTGTSWIRWPPAQQPRGDLRLDVEALGRQRRATAPRRRASPCSRFPCRSATPPNSRFVSAGEHPVGGEGDERRIRPRPRRNREPYTTVGLAVEDRPTSAASCCRIQLEVGVLDGDDRSACAWRRPSRIALPLPAFRAACSTVIGRPSPTAASSTVAGAVGRSVVDDEDFARQRQIDGEQPVDDGARRALLRCRRER